MNIGYEEPCYDDNYEGDNSWGKGSPLKVGLVVRWDSLAFWSKVPHKHIRNKYDDPRSPMESERVNSCCDRCYKWFNIKSGKLDNRFNKKGKHNAAGN